MNNTIFTYQRIICTSGSVRLVQNKIIFEQFSHKRGAFDVRPVVRQSIAVAGFVRTTVLAFVLEAGINRWITRRM